MSLVEDAKAGIRLNTPNSSCTASLSVSSPSMFLVGTVPPLSPRTGSGSFFSPRSSIRCTGAGSGSLSSAVKRVSEPMNEIIPQFYFPNGPTPWKEIVDEFLKEIDFYFVSHSDGLHFSDFVPLTKEVCKLPSFFSSSLFKKIDMEKSGLLAGGLVEYYCSIFDAATRQKMTRMAMSRRLVMHFGSIVPQNAGFGSFGPHIM